MRETFARPFGSDLRTLVTLSSGSMTYRGFFNHRERRNLETTGMTNGESSVDEITTGRKWQVRELRSGEEHFGVRMGVNLSGQPRKGRQACNSGVHPKRLPVGDFPQDSTVESLNYSRNWLFPKQVEFFAVTRITKQEPEQWSTQGCAFVTGHHSTGSGISAIVV
ncbi:hypothetical protein EI94DRAFT_1785477 [Lactarius quietus]|nr:hypothetical protein EI94DRAFT_1785477 [Lactarius quietus]